MVHGFARSYFLGKKIKMKITTQQIFTINETIHQLSGVANIKTDTTFVIFNEQVLLLYSNSVLYFFQAENVLFFMFWISPYLYPNHFTIFIFIFISPSRSIFFMKKSVNQEIKLVRPKSALVARTSPCLFLLNHRHTRWVFHS